MGKPFTGNMTILITVIVLLVVVATIGVALYIGGTYLLLGYDRRLARNDLVEAKYTEGAPSDDPFARDWHPPPRRMMWKAVLTEILVTWLCFTRYPLGYLPRKHRPGRGPSHPILLIHGLMHNRSAWHWMARRLRKTRIGPVYTLNLRPRHASIQHFALEIEKMAAVIEKETGTSKLILIGHSMGGLVASYYAERIAPYRQVSHVITLGSPLHGTRSAVLSGGKCGRQMRPNSPLIEDLIERIRRNPSSLYFHVASKADNMIFPCPSAVFGDHPQRELVLDWQGHMTLLRSRQVLRQIIRWLKVTVPVGDTSPQTGTGKQHLPVSH